jgi:hypothetical protein
MDAELCHERSALLIEANKFFGITRVISCLEICQAFIELSQPRHSVEVRSLSHIPRSKKDIVGL